MKMMSFKSSLFHCLQDSSNILMLHLYNIGFILFNGFDIMMCMTETKSYHRETTYLKSLSLLLRSFHSTFC